MNHDTRLLIVMIHQTTLLHGLSTLRGFLSLWQNQHEALTYGWDPKVVIYPYGLGDYWWRLVAISILNIGNMISYEIETMCPLRWSKGHVIMKSMATIIPLVEFSIYFSELEYIIMSGICNSRIWKVILIGDSTTLLYYGH